MLQNETPEQECKMMRTCYEVMDGGRPIGLVVAPDGRPQAGPGAATVLLTRLPRPSAA